MHDAVLPAALASGDLVGRDADLRLLEQFVHRALRTGGARVLAGDPGVGKTVLLDRACRTAATSGARILRGGGVEFEAEVSFAGLNQLLLPLHRQLGELPDEQTAALTRALGLGAGAAADPPADPLAVSAAALAVLERSARRYPLLVVVDDVQWMDRSSAKVLGFVARRLEGSRIGLLMTARTDSDCVLLHAGLPRHEVRPLDEPAATQLLASRFPRLAGSVRRRVLAAAQGNPLALLELPVSITEGQRRAVLPLPSVLPLSDHLQAVFAHRLRGLPAATRRLLLLAALDGTGDLRTLSAASAEDGWLDDLAPAEEERLVRVDTSTGRVAFRHPLIGAAAVGLSTSSERRRVHHVLAELFPHDPERRAWHLAEAVVGPDEQAAVLLEMAAERALHKGDAVRAVHALLRAADLSPRGADRARRLAAAAYVGADAAGQLSSVPALLRAARRADPDTVGSLEVGVAAAYHLLNGDGDVDTAHLVLVRGIESALEHGYGGPAVEEAVRSLMLVCHFSARDEPWHPFESALSRLRPRAPALLTVSDSVYADPAGRVSSTELDELDRLIATLDAEVDPTRIVRVAMAAFYVDRLSACRSALWRVVRDGRDGGAATSAVQALTMLCHDAFRAGWWEESAGLADEAVSWSERLGYRLLSMPGVHCRALLAAARGDEAGVQSLTEDLVTWASPRGVRLMQLFAHRARALAALGRGDFEEAYRLATSISSPGHLTPHVPLALWMAKDLVEAAARTGRHEEAAAHVAAMRRAEVFRLRPRLALLAAGAAALVATGDDASERYREALAVPGAEQFPFERARVQLAYGEHLRRIRATSEARSQLAAAVEVLERLDARPWVEHATNELRASGLPHRPTRGWGVAALTAQEQEIADLAASGLSNKQIGSRLYLSPRTVSGHLYRIFPKLGITTRVALRDALSAAPPAGAPGD